MSRDVTPRHLTTHTKMARTWSSPGSTARCHGDLPSLSIDCGDCEQRAVTMAKLGPLSSRARRLRDHARPLRFRTQPSWSRTRPSTSRARHLWLRAPTFSSRARSLSSRTRPTSSCTRSVFTWTAHPDRVPGQFTGRVSRSRHAPGLFHLAPRRSVRDLGRGCLVPEPLRSKPGRSRRAAWRFHSDTGRFSGKPGKTVPKPGRMHSETGILGLASRRTRPKA
jgi:hypothetical protein